MLSNSKGYPWRASLTKKARCATCEYLNSITCKEGKKVQFPLYSYTHDCPDFKFKPKPVVNQPELRFAECGDCSHNLKNHCDGIGWHPISKIEGKCEFFRQKNLICKNAIPYFQYCNHLRNNYCRLPPHKRDGDMSRSWKWNCLYAHGGGVETFHCYKPKKAVK